MEVVVGVVDSTVVGRRKDQWVRITKLVRSGTDGRVIQSKLQSSSSDRDRGSIPLACTLYADYAGEGTWSESRAGAGLKYIHGPAISLRTPKEHPSPRK
jgi:hypothetical protein